MTKGRGAAKHRVVFQRYQVVGQDDYGADQLDWGDYATAYARVVHGTGAERREAAQESARVSATFYVLRNALTAALQPKDRIVWEGNWDIVSAVPSLAYNREVEVTAVRAI